MKTIKPYYLLSAGTITLLFALLLISKFINYAQSRPLTANSAATSTSTYTLAADIVLTGQLIPVPNTPQDAGIWNGAGYPWHPMIYYLKDINNHAQRLGFKNDDFYNELWQKWAGKCLTVGGHIATAAELKTLTPTPTRRTRGLSPASSPTPLATPSQEEIFEVDNFQGAPDSTCFANAVPTPENYSPSSTPALFSRWVRFTARIMISPDNPGRHFPPGPLLFSYRAQFGNQTIPVVIYETGTNSDTAFIGPYGTDPGGFNAFNESWAIFTGWIFSPPRDGNSTNLIELQSIQWTVAPTPNPTSLF